MAAKIKGLQLWCRKMTEGYPHVDISNFTTAWRNGLAFCAIIHRFRPDLIDYDSLSPENVFENNKLAFEVGESELNIPAFLEADDMARLKVPDKLSVITYVSQYYNYLGNLPQLGGPGVKGAVKKKGGVAVSGTKRPPDTSTKVASEPSNKKTVSAKEDANNVANSSTASSPRKGTLGDKCGICNNKVYLLERHIDSGKLYHRSCYRHSDLSPTNKVLTKSPFMAPSLHNEKAYKGHGVKDISQTPVNDSRGKYNNGNDKQKENESSSVLANLKSGLKRVEAGSGSVASGVGVGSKHSMQADKDKEEDAKKAKVQPRNLFGGSGTGKENTNNVSTGRNESVYPLSGKEAKKLEKRRQEILASENSTPINKGAKRGMPLIFQTKDQSLPSPSSASASSSSSSSTNKMSSGSDGSGDGIAVKFSSNASVSLLNSKSKDSKTTPSTGVGNGNEPNKGNAVQNLQQKFSGQSQSSSDIESHVTGVGANAPTARPRIAGSKIASSPFLDNDNNKTGNGSVHTGPTTSDSVSIRNKKDVQVNASTPVAAPRKSVAGNIGDAKLAAPQKDALSKVAHSSLLSHESSSSDDNGTPRSARSKSSTTSSTSSTSNPPPALPLSLPPSLPQSKPPPLPTTPPPQVSASTTTKHSRSSSPSSSSDVISTSSADKDCRKDLRHLHPSSSSSSSSTPSSSSVATTAKISLKPVNPPPPTPSDKKGEGGVLSGLLASLAGVRGRSASTPNSLTTAQQQQQQQPTSHKDPGTTATPKAVSKLASTAITTTTTTTPSITVLSSTTSNRKHSEPAIKTGDLTVDVTFPVPVPSTDQQSNHGPALKKVIPNSTPASSSSSSVHNAGSKSEAVNVLNSLKPVAKTNATSTTTVSGGSKPSETVMSHKSKDTINENKVGSLVKNYLSKSKEDLSSSGCQHSKQAVHSNSEDVFKKVSKPPGAKDAIRDGPHKDGPNVGSDRFNVGLKKGESNKNEDKMKTDATPVSTRYDVKLKKVGIPNDPGKVDTVGPRQVVNHKMEDEGRKEKPSTLDVPQWKKDIEDRKKKLREDIIRSETPSKWTQKNDKDKEKALPTKDVAPKVLPTKDVAPKVLPTKDVAPKVLPTKDVAPKVLPTKDVAPKVLPTKDVAPKPEEPTPKPVKTPSSSKEDRNKLNWQLEAERRMAAFALFDGEEESKSQDGDFKMEGKMAEMNEQRKREAGLKVNKLKDVNESTKHKTTKIGLKSVDIDIGVLGVSDKRGNDLSKAQSINNNNSLTLAEDKKPVKDVSSPRSDTKDKTVLNNKVEDGKLSLSVDKEKDTVRKPASPKVSPKLKRKITVLGPKNQKNANQEPSVSPPTTPSVTQEKKRIAVTGMFDFDNDSASSDFESSLSLSTGQMSLEEDQTPHRPPRTKSHRSKAESPKQISAIELQQQLMEIDNRLTDLELRGRDLEDSIRNASFQEGSSEAVSTNNNDDYDDADDHLMMEWFQLVSEKNDLVRQEADLVYLSREQDLEDEQEQLDHQLRYLLGKEEMIKSPQEKEEESYLLQRKVDIVNQRSSIIESMDEDRLRYEEEDRGIEYVLKSKGLWKDDDGTFLAEQGRIVGNSTFFA